VFAVLFEVHPYTEQWDAYLGYAKMLRPDLEAIDGFVDNIRYRSLTRPGWILSLSSWRNEKALVRWRTCVRHHDIQVKGRSEVLADYHLRVGQLTTDSHVPEGNRLEEQRLDVTEVGKGTAVTLTNPRRRYQDGPIDELDAGGLARRFGLQADAEGLTAWDIFDAVQEPGSPILVQSWKDLERAAASRTGERDDLRRRTIRIVRDYGMFDRRESPQYYPEISHPTNA
jgi:heme-degrading monooxygenase HmoA